MNIIILDLDGTVFDITHRLPLIVGDNKDYDAFYRACVGDKPISNVIEVVSKLHGNGYTRLIAVTGRSDIVREETFNQCIKNGLLLTGLYMRKNRDWRPDHVIKEEALAEIRRKYPGDNILCAFEDRKQVVDMWRRNGILCLQVADGDF